MATIIRPTDISGTYENVLAQSHEGEGKKLIHRLVISQFTGDPFHHYLVYHNKKLHHKSRSLTEARDAYNELMLLSMAERILNE